MTSKPWMSRFSAITPGLAAAVAFGTSDALVKVVLLSGCSVITMLLVRSVAAVSLTAALLLFRPIAQINPRARFTAAAVGLLFAVLIYLLFNAIDKSDVPTAILSYFVYPLLTGFGASLLGIEVISARGIICALIALIGLAIMIGARTAGFASAGVGFALGAAVCRTAILLVTRRFLSDTDVTTTSWYSNISTLIAFIGLSVVAADWTTPHSTSGWISLAGVSVATTAAIQLLFLSTILVGPFRSALIMQLEPLTATVLSIFLVGQAIAPLQMVGMAIMLTSLAAFQVWR
jgi:drug/metabolite transporter (DMT)-like permease